MIKIRFTAEAFPARDRDQRFDSSRVRSACDAYAFVPINFYIYGCSGNHASVRDIDAEDAKFKRVTVA